MIVPCSCMHWPCGFVCSCPPAHGLRWHFLLRCAQEEEEEEEKDLITMSKKCRDVLYINSPFESVRRGRKPKTMCLIWRTPRSLQTEIRQHTTTTTRLDMKLSHIANLVSRTVFFRISKHENRSNAVVQGSYQHLSQKSTKKIKDEKSEVGACRRSHAKIEKTVRFHVRKSDRAKKK